MAKESALMEKVTFGTRGSWKTIYFTAMELYSTLTAKLYFLGFSINTK